MKSLCVAIFSSNFGRSWNNGPEMGSFLHGGLEKGVALPIGPGKRQCFAVNGSEKEVLVTVCGPAEGGCLLFL